jgi:hypothetical protein
VTNPLVSIAVTPPAPKIAGGTTQQFAATGTYADNSTQNLTSTVVWNSSNTSTATISNAQGTQGLATGIAAGTTAITAALNGITSPPDTLTVSSANLVSIAVTPASVTISLGQQQQYTATGTFSDTTTQDISNTVTWASSNPAQVPITVSGNATGAATTTSAVSITATKGSITSPPATISVVPPTLASIAITPSTSTLAQGTHRQYTATGTQTNGSKLDVTNLGAWSSLTPALASVGPHGLVKGISTGTAIIQVVYSGVTQAVNIDVTNPVLDTITVTPITATIPAGVTQNFTATAAFHDGTTQDLTLDSTWASSDTTVATIPTQGRALALSTGAGKSANITATFGSITGQATINVSTSTLSSITVSPATALLAPGSNTTFQAIGNYINPTATANLSGVSVWASSNPLVVTVAGGVASGQSAGTATITAKYQGITSATGGQVVVTSSPLSSITVSPAAAAAPQGINTAFSATGIFANQTTQNLTTNVTWATTVPSVANISNTFPQNGVAVGTAPGSTGVTAVFAGIVGTATFNVTNATIVSIVVTPVNQNVPVGTQVSFKAVGTFDDSSTIDVTNQVTWSSSVATVATISSNGLASTAGVGTTSIQAVFTQNGVTVSDMTSLTAH